MQIAQSDGKVPVILVTVEVELPWNERCAAVVLQHQLFMVVPVAEMGEGICEGRSGTTESQCESPIPDR